MSNYRFFLSYARRNDLVYDGQLIPKFFEDLAHEVISKGGDKIPKVKTEVGFFDQLGINTGDIWDVTLAEALRTCRTMVCLFSRAYFESEYCGKEFQVFNSRVRDFSKANKVASPPLILPVLWHSPDTFPPLPACASDIQYTHKEFGELYAMEGLEFLMRMNNKYEAEYQEFLIRFSKRLIKVADKMEYAMPFLQECPPLKTVQSCFHEPKPEPIVVDASANAKGEDEDEDGPELGNTGPGVVHFVFVAGHSKKLKQIRTRLEAYAELGGRYWKPYIPTVDKAAGIITQRVLTDMGLQQEVLPFTKKLLDQLSNADEKESNVIVLIVVDPWSLLVEEYRERLKKYDKTNLVRCAILVVRNDQEQEPGIGPDKIQLKVNETFVNTLLNKNMYLRVAVTSESALCEEVRAAIIEIQRKLADRANLLRPVPQEDAGFTNIPKVAGPGGGHNE